MNLEVPVKDNIYAVNQGEFRKCGILQAKICLEGNFIDDEIVIVEEK